MPATHNGSEFTFDLAFSEDFPLSYVTLRDDAFTVDGGNVENAQRKVPGSNQTWTITVKPLGAGTISITLPETTDCNATGAICTDDERKLSNSTPASHRRAAIKLGRRRTPTGGHRTPAGLPSHSEHQHTPAPKTHTIAP